MRPLLIPLLLLAFAGDAAAQQSQPPLPPPSPPGQQPQAAPEAEAATIEGFRTARFGMTEAEVKAAIRRDFPQAAERIVSEQTPVERTQVLTVTAANLIPDAGTARISYILGHRSKRLIQVSILWGPPADPTARPEALVNAAEALRTYFASLAWRAGSVAGGVVLADGSTLIFRGLDEKGRMAQLQALPAAVPPATASPTTPPSATPPSATPPPATPPSAAAGPAPRPFGLRLAYVADPLEPDVFRLQRGQF